jgi:hypothetical protein
MRQPSFASSLFGCDDASSLTTLSGNRFIRKLPDDRALSYLHKLYAPLDTIKLDRLRSALASKLPADFEAFLLWSNGASLFDNQLYLFGLVEDFSRDIAPERQQPLSIIDKNSGSGREGWTRIGSVVGWSIRYDIEVHETGACALTTEEGEYAAQTFEQCVGRIIDRLGSCFSCDGVNDRTYAEVEVAVASLVLPN